MWLRETQPAFFHASLQNVIPNYKDLLTEKHFYVYDAKRKQNKEISDMNDSVFRSILEKYFSRGFRLASKIETKKFKRRYEEQTGTSCNLDDDQIEQRVKNCGIENNNRVYIPEIMLSNELKNKLLSYIDERFDMGVQAIYFKALFDKFSDDFLDYTMYNEDMLRAYLAYFVSDEYIIGNQYLSKKQLESMTAVDEIRSYLKENGFPIKISELSKNLSHIPESKIRTILGSNLEFIRNSKGEYFHADSLVLNDKELQDISDLIRNEIELNDFISGNELYNQIRNKYPNILEKNEAFSMIGWRDALKYKLKDKFAFMGNIISAKDQQLSMGNVFYNFAKKRQEFTLKELVQFTKNVGADNVIYFDSLYKNAVRINENDFVNKDYVSFQTKETDEILEKFCPGDYVSLAKISNFGIFPNASYPWNKYLLENYLSFHSQQFFLLHSGYNKNYVVGAMVRKNSSIKDYDELMVRIIADSSVSLVKEDALNYLANEGYIARRSYNKIEQVLIKARTLRNRKEN